MKRPLTVFEAVQMLTGDALKAGLRWEFDKGTNKMVVVGRDGEIVKDYRPIWNGNAFVALSP